MNRPDFGGDSIAWRKMESWQNTAAPAHSSGGIQRSSANGPCGWSSETAAERGDRHGAVTHVARQLGIGPESLRQWVRQAEVDGGQRAGLTTEERERLKALERENRELRRANEILKARRLSSGRSSTAARRDDHLHRRAPELVRGRADLPDAGDRPVDLLRRPLPAAVGPGRPRRRAQRRDRPGPRGATSASTACARSGGAAPRGHRASAATGSAG